MVIMAEHLGGNGKVGILELSFPFYVTEQKTNTTNSVIDIDDKNDDEFEHY